MVSPEGEFPSQKGWPKSFDHFLLNLKQHGLKWRSYPTPNPTITFLQDPFLFILTSWWFHVLFSTAFGRRPSLSPCSRIQRASQSAFRSFQRGSSWSDGETFHQFLGSLRCWKSPASGFLKWGIWKILSIIYKWKLPWIIFSIPRIPQIIWWLPKMGDTMGYPLSLDGSWKIPSIYKWMIWGQPFVSKPPYVAMLMGNAMMNPWFMIGNAMIDGIIHD